MVCETLENRSLLSAVVVQLSAQQDNTIYNSGSGNQSNGQGQHIVAGGSTSTANARRGLIYFDVDSAKIPDGSTILDVVLTMNLAYTTGGATAVSVHRLLRSWGEGSSNAAGNEVTGAAASSMDATWKFAQFDGSPWKKPGGDFASASGTVTVKSKGAYEWSGSGLVADVQDWLDSPNTNNGWLIRSKEVANNIKAFLSRNSSNAALRPTLEITYEEPIVPGIVEGRKWFDKNANGIRESKVILDLDLQYANGKSLYNNLGGKEYWYQATSTKAWYYLKPDGTLNKWSGKAGKLTGTVVDRLDPQVWYSPDTLLGSRTKSDEPWMNGFTFELVNSAGKVVATTTSQNLDRNRDGKINPELEQGWYRFQNVAPGSYTVREVVPKGWLQSASRTSPGAAEAYKLDQTLGLSVSGGLSEDFGGLGERWLKGKKGWYYITPIGDLFLWNGKAVTKNAPLSGTLVASPGASYFNDVSLLHAAKNPVLNVKAGAVLTRVDFGNFKPLTLQGQSYLSAIPTWIRNSPGFLIKLLSPAQAAKAGNPAVPALYAWAVVSTGNGKDDLIPYSSASAKRSSTGQQQSSGPKASSTASSSSTTGSAASTFNLNLLNSYGAAVIDNLFSSLNF